MTASIDWKRQHDYLWTGRHDGKPVGTIEQGGRYTFIDADGAEHHGFRTLEDAQHAADQLVLPQHL
jgi:hypothetical protein